MSARCSRSCCVSPWRGESLANQRIHKMRTDMRSTNGHERQPVDFDLHGLAGIRLINPSPHEVAAVARQLGPIQRPLEREPDISIRFVERLPPSSRMKYLGVDEAGFTDDAFLVLRSKHKARAKV